MAGDGFHIARYSDAYREQLLRVWEKSVLATHHFLSQTDFLSVKELVKTMNFNDLEVYCLLQQNTVAGFTGVSERKIEMLFLSPEYIGRGLGKKLMEFAVNELQIAEVDVNEQNVAAVRFYEKFGFRTYERTDKDEQGKKYPLLRMRLDRES